MRWVALVLVFAIVLATRLFFAFQTPYLSGDESYLQYRLVNNILETGFPGLADKLSWGGSYLDLSPLFAYILAFFALLIGPTFALKIVPNVFASLLVFPVFLIVFHSSRRFWIAVLASFVASFVPVLFANTINDVSVLSLVLPLFFWLVFCWMRLPDMFWVYNFLVAVVFLSFLHPSALLLVFGLLLFVALCPVERLPLPAANVELLLFSSGFVLWSQFLLFKRAIVEHGAAVFWLNIPSGLLSSFFARLSLFDVLWQIGFFPLVVGLYVIYKNVVMYKDSDLYLFFSFVAVIGVLLWFKIVELLFGLMLLGVLLVVLSAKGFILFQDFIRSTKFASLERFFSFLIVLTVIFTSVVPSFVAADISLENTISKDQVDALLWLRKNTDSADIVMAPVLMGNYVSAIADRADVIDTWFLLHDDAEQRFNDVDRVFSSVLETEVVAILDKYDSSFVLLPHGSPDVVFSNADCFHLRYGDTTRVFEKDPSCHLRVVS